MNQRERLLAWGTLSVTHSMFFNETQAIQNFIVKTFRWANRHGHDNDVCICI